MRHQHTALAELRQRLTDALAAGLPDTDPAVLRWAVEQATDDWRVTRNTIDGGSKRESGIELQTTLPRRSLTGEERAEREAIRAAVIWDEGDGPPPERVSIEQLLDQSTWWRMNDPSAPEGQRRTVPVRLEDMTHEHRLGLLAFLRERAAKLKMSYEYGFISGPQPNGDMASDCFDSALGDLFAQPDVEWLDDQPLVRELVARTTGASTWRPIAEAPRDGTPIMARVREDATVRALHWDDGAMGWKDNQHACWTAVEWRRLTDADEWRPIAEAPRDGTPIMTRLGGDDAPRLLCWNASACRSDDLGEFVSCLVDVDALETAGCWVDAYDGTLTGSAVGEADPVEWREMVSDERYEYDVLVGGKWDR